MTRPAKLAIAILVAAALSSAAVRGRRPDRPPRRRS